MTHFTGRLTFLLGAPAAPAAAHSSEGAEGGVVTGFPHPSFGCDPTAAMVAVGLWGAFLVRSAIWPLPVTFPLEIVLGGNPYGPDMRSVSDLYPPARQPDMSRFSITD